MATIGQIKAARAAQKEAGVSGRLNAGDFIKQADGTYVNRNTAGVSSYQGRPQTPQPAPVAAPNLPTAPTQANSTTPQPNVVNSSNLAPVVKTPLPDATVSTYGGVDGAVDSVIAQAKTAQEDYLNAIKEQGTISESVDRTAQDKAKQEADKFTAQLEQEQLANRRRIEKLRTNTTGMLESGITIEEDRLNRESLSKQADIAILQTAAARNYDTAAAIADRTVAMKLEQSKANLEALKLLDSRAYGEVQAKKEREYKVLERNENTIAQLKLKVAQYAGSNAPSILAKLSALDTTKPGAFDEAVAIAGKYSEDPLDRAIKQAQLDKAKSDAGIGDTVSTKILATKQFQAAQAAQNLKNTLQKAKDAVEKYGNKEKLNAEGKGILDTLKVQLRSEISTALEQGVVVPGEAASFDAIAGELNKSY